MSSTEAKRVAEGYLSPLEREKAAYREFVDIDALVGLEREPATILQDQEKDHG